MATVLAAGFALASLGGLAGTSAGASATAGAGHTSGLGPARFRALSAVAVAAVALDRASQPAGRRAAFRHLAKTCDALDRRDALLGPTRSACLASVAVGEGSDKLLTSSCRVQSSCASAAGKVRTATLRLIDLLHRVDGAIQAAHITAACQGALVTTQTEYAAYAAFADAFGLLQRALTSGSAADLAAAQTALEKALALGHRVPSANHQLASFRRDCG